MKKLRIEFCLLTVVTIALAGCGKEKKEEANVSEISPSNPPVGILMSNDHKITIHTGPEGPLYSVKGPDGKQLATEISKEELQAGFPDVNLNGLWAGLEKGESGVSDLDATNYRILNERIQVVPKTFHR